MAATLTIGRIRADCQVAGTPSAALDLGARTERALAGHLAHALRGTLAGWFDRDDESVWIIRRLDLSLMTDAGAPADVLAAAVATTVGRALSDIMRDQGDGVTVLRFRTRAAYVAQFVADIARGDAWGRWYFAPFAGLEMLAQSAAIRTALVEDPLQGLAALDSLADADLAAVAASLSAAEEAIVLQQFVRLTAGSSGAATDVFAQAWSALSRALDAGVEHGLRLFAFVRTPQRDRSASLAIAVGALVDCMVKARTALARGDSVGAERALERFAIPASVRQALLTGLQFADDGTPEAANERVVTRYGGLCLLMRDLDTRPWETWTAGWPGTGADAAASLLRWLVACLCGGRTRARAIFDDRGCRALFGISRRLTASELRRWLTEVGSCRRRTLAAEADAAPSRAGWSRLAGAIAAGAMRDFAQRLPGFADSAPEYLWQNFLDFKAACERNDMSTIVYCGRPPLHVVLSLTGMTRGMMAGRDGHGRPILVFASEAS
jgi:hypothetical protein